MQKYYRNLKAVWIMILGISITFSVSAEDADFLGEHYGAKLGVNHSKSRGNIEASGESTLAYGVQGGYVQGGYNFKLGSSIVGLGGYADMHGFEMHPNGVAYGGFSSGVDVKFGLPVGNWMPYVKLGYGYNAGTSDLRDIKQFGFNKTFGGEYKLDKNWSIAIEYKFNSFGKYSTTIYNQTFMFGFNYYLDKRVVVEAVPDYTAMPLPEKAPDIPPEFAPPP